MDLNNFVKVYDNALDTNVCRNILDLSKKETLQRVSNKGYPQFSTFNITVAAEEKQSPSWLKVQNQLVMAIKSYSEQYMKELDCSDFWPAENSLEQIRFIKYECEENDRFDKHVDVLNHESARRFLAIYFYLNDVELGGETDFPNLDMQVKPKEGRCLIYPPSWMFPHSGKAPQSNDKNIIVTYLHYL
ncbi:2OG-Fe(II) oxygenase superfamily protein [Synechococcus phage S-SZBM1]|uniref:2OG-Fe(II) oxygenase superfamily protein n=1 Tax=Synechococcus phage S-SZBM1 TaxID=2926475 RepID=A0AC61TSP6_9CAUD|nr:2OG-Fe(II) oxygenase [Synechococcus phage S-SZBM1]UNH61263.1 2OG-Fe(II) oxygenase superfamily protein [Synechococcus phage S-SZBM1]